MHQEKLLSLDAGDAESLTVTAEASDGDNIYINNKRAESGMSVRSAVTDMVRIIVQSRQAEPAIYYIKISGENTPAGNAELDAVTVFPGDVKAQPDAGDILTFTVANNVERVAFLPETMNHKATVEIEGKTYNSGETSDTAAVSVGENTFSLKVTSENGEKTKLYKIKSNP